MRNYRKTSPSRVADFIWEFEECVVTANLKKFGSQMIASVWITKTFQSGFIHLVAAQEVLLRSQSERSAGAELDELVAGQVSALKSISSEPSDGYQMSFLPGKNEREGIALEHLHLQQNKVSRKGYEGSVIHYTARDYTLLVEFGISNPAAVLARTQLLQVKSIQQRIYLAREQGILQSHGKGRTSSADERRGD